MEHNFIVLNGFDVGIKCRGFICRIKLPDKCALVRHLKAGHKNGDSGLRFLSVKLNAKSCGLGVTLFIFNEGIYFFAMVLKYAGNVGTSKLPLIYPSAISDFSEIDRAFPRPVAASCSVSTE